MRTYQAIIRDLLDAWSRWMGTDDGDSEDGAMDEVVTLLGELRTKARL